MTIAIIAGGQGTRLWPLSKPDQPKHLLSLVNEDSLLQNTISRVESLTENIFIVTEASHSDEVKKQIPKYAGKIIVEPTRRGTAHCILFALSEIKKQVSAEEVIVFLHADHHIGDVESFLETVRAAAETSDRLKRIALIGVSPDYPATGFGYIKTGKEVADQNELPVLKVEEFVEKPDEKTALAYLKSKKYLWNLGLFAGSINTFESEIEKHNKDLWERYKLLQTENATKHYFEFPNEPIDTALIEKVSELVVVPGKFDWADVGSFKDLYEILKNGSDNVHKGGVYDINSKDSLVIAHKKPIVTIGLEGMIVVDTPDGILVCPKEKCQLVKDGVEKLKSKNGS